MSIDLKKLMHVGLHYGHQKSRGNPKMANHVWGMRNGIQLINVLKTAQGLEQACNFLESIAAQGKQTLLVGTKKSAQQAIAKLAGEVSQPFVTHRWVGGTLTNYSQVKKSVTKLLHFEDIIAKSAQFPYTKKELNTFQKMVDRLNKSVGGIRKLRWPVGAIVLIDASKEQTALYEAVESGIPVVALVDTNSDPSLVNYVIPGNDDSPKGIELVLEYLGQAIKAGQAKAETQELQDEIVSRDADLEGQLAADGESEGKREKRGRARTTGGNRPSTSRPQKRTGDA